MFFRAVILAALILVAIYPKAKAEVVDTDTNAKVLAQETDAGPKAAIEPKAEPIPEERKPTLKLEVTPKEAGIGEVITWKLHIKHRKTDKIHLSSSASFGTLEVRKKDIVEVKQEGDWVEEVLQVELIGFDPEKIDLKVQKLTIVGEDGRAFEVETESASVEIKSAVANEPQPALKEDKGDGERVYEKNYTLLWILGAILAAGVIALLTLFARWLWSKRAPKAAPPPPPPRPAHKIALEKLNALKESNLLELGLIKDFHVRLSEAVREYLGNRWRFDSLELTSEELLTALKKTSITREDFNRTDTFLEETDLVKFAKVILTLEESRAHLSRSIEFVISTTPKMEEPAETETKAQKAKETETTKESRGGLQ